MHRLRNKKKTKGDSDAESDVPPVPPVSKNFLKKKPSAPAELPQVELDHVLPSSDDFRTSLLMPNLAQRFSILKAEQEALAAANAQAAGGSSKEEFNPRFMAGLGDIAETASIDGSIRSAHNRLTSRSDERRPSEDGDGSMMNRGRAGEGNVLFGGRQKVYKVTPGKLRGASSMEDLGGGGGGGGGFGRSLGTSDVPDVPYARKEWRKGYGEDEERKSHDLVEPDRNRYTASSTNSTPTTAARLSTAATSINSQPGASVSATPSPVSPTMAGNKPRRPLYEQALDQHLQEQQSTALGRLERLASLRRMGSASPPRGSSPERAEREESDISPTSPTSHSMPWEHMRTSPDTPLSPPAEEEEDGREKQARPAGFDTFDFGLHLQKPISPPMSSRANEFQFPAHAPFSSGRPADRRKQQRSPERVASPVSDRSLSLGAVGARRSPSLVRRSPSPPARTSDELEARSYLGSSNPDSGRSSLDNNNEPAPRRSGESLSVRGLNVDGGGSMRRRSPSSDGGPLNRVASEVSSVSSRSRVSRTSHDSSVSNDEPAKAFLEALKPAKNPTISASQPRFNYDTAAAEDDSPTLPSTGQGQGLSLLVQQHLRSGSDASSMYAPSTYNRMSRVSRYGAPANANKVGDKPSDSGGSTGNIWQYEDAAAAEVSSEDSAPSSPSRGRTPPRVPLKAPSRSGSSMGNRAEDGDGAWERGRREGSRPGSEWGDSRPGTRAPSRAGTERSLSRAGAASDPDDQDWEQQLAFRRQIVQQNLRNQEKINSQHEMPYDHTRELASRGGIKAKGANIIRTDNGRSPMMAPRAESRERGRLDGRMMDGRPRGPMSPPGLPAHGRNGLPAHPGHPGPGQRQRPPLATNHTFGHGSRSADPLSPTSSRSRQTSPRNSPPRVRQQLSQEQMNGNRGVRQQHSQEQMNGNRGVRQQLSQEQMNGNRGQPMGWQDSWGQPPQPQQQTRSTPSTPIPRQGPMPPLPTGGKPFRPSPADGFRDDLSRAMMTGQSGITEVPPQRRRNDSSPEEPLANVCSTFEDEDHRPAPSLRRPRGNSLIQGVQGLRSRGGDRESVQAQLPPLTTTGLLPPNVIGTSNRSPAATSPMVPSPAAVKSPAAIMQQIANANSSLAPARKRAVNKLEIGEPTLLSKTSHIPTINLPNRPADPGSPIASSAISVKSSAASTKSRKRNNTIFGVFARNNTAEEIPSLPPVPTTSGAGGEEREEVRNRLRKSTSDGGALAARARMGDVEEMRRFMPKTHGKMAGGMI